MNFNDCTSSLDNMQQEEVFIQLQTLYAEQEVLLQYFEGVNKQFQNWLNAKPFNALVVSGILPKLEPVLRSLTRLRFQIMNLEDEELAPQTVAKLAKLKRKITSIMIYQEVDLYESRLAQLAVQDENLRQEEIRKATAEEAIKSQDNAASNVQLLPKLFYDEPILPKSFYDEPIMIVIKGMKNNNFAIGKYPITQREWQAIMGNNPSHFKGDNLPVETVNWYDANEYIARLNQKTGKNYRLPTEAEWEYAAWGGERFEYGCSDNINEVAWFVANSGNKTQPVGTKKANAYGLHDMLGNVYEWCQDEFKGSSRVIRGGGCGSDATNCRPACRNGSTPTFRNYYLGFRVCISLL